MSVETTVEAGLEETGVEVPSLPFFVPKGLLGGPFGVFLKKFSRVVCILSLN